MTDDVKYAMEEERGYASRGPRVEPWILQARSYGGDHVTFVASSRAARGPRSVDAGGCLDDRARTADTSARGGWQSPASSQVAELVTRSRSIHHSRRRVARPTRLERAGSWRRRSKHHRRLSLVHGLGPRHDDQPRRTDAVDGTDRRSPWNAADLHSLFRAMAFYQISFRKVLKTVSTTPPTRRSGFFTPSTVTSPSVTMWIPFERCCRVSTRSSGSM